MLEQKRKAADKEKKLLLAKRRAVEHIRVFESKKAKTVQEATAEAQKLNVEVA